MSIEQMTTHVQIEVVGPEQVESRLGRIDETSFGSLRGALSEELRWLLVLRDGLAHEPYLLEATSEGRTVGVLPLCLVASRLFGRYLVGLPYLNSGGVRAADPSIAESLIDHAVSLAEKLQVKHLELRHEVAVPHGSLPDQSNSKVHMRLDLPESETALWEGLGSKVKNQLRKGEKQGFEVRWGGLDLLGEFYEVFSRNMRDLGTPVYSSRLFASVIEQFPNGAEFCVLRLQGQAVASALLLHGSSVTEVPSASSLRQYNGTNANMHMYWQLLKRAVNRGSRVFDFGRSSRDSGTYRFKQQWGAAPVAACWQYHCLQGSMGEMRPENPKYQLAIRVWKQLPLAVTRWLGPSIVRGIP
jgi:serine/alanine adding enzyme